jgi:hypothetical protein
MGSKTDNLPNMRQGLREQIFALCDICAGFNSSALVISCIFPLTARHFPDVYVSSLVYAFSFSAPPPPSSFSPSFLSLTLFSKYLLSVFISLLKCILSVRIYILQYIYLYWIENRVAGRIHNWRAKKFHFYAR